MTCTVVDKPDIPSRRKPSGTWQQLIQRLAEIPSEKALAVPAADAGLEGSFRASVCIAAARMGMQVSIAKGDGVYLIFRRADR